MLLTLVPLLLTLSQSPAKAQWRTDGLPVCTEANDQYLPFGPLPPVISDGMGGMIVAWVDNRSGNGYDIYAQRIDAQGNVTWTQGGIVACSATGDQLDPGLASDGSGGAIIVWEDYRSPSSGTGIYAQHIDASGTATWAGGGVPVCTASGPRAWPLAIPDGSGGAIVTWGSDARHSYPREGVYVQRLGSTGSPMWTPDGVLLSEVENGELRVPTLASDGASGAIIAWEDHRGLSNAYPDIYVQRVNASGTPQWPPNGIPVCAAAYSQVNPYVQTDGVGGAFVIWSDSRSNAGYDVYAQHVSASGAMLWSHDGVAVCGAVGDQFVYGLSGDGAGGFYAAWEDYRSGAADVYAQRIGPAGTRLWSSAGVPVCTASGDQVYPRLVSDAVGGTIISWEDHRGDLGDVYAQRLDAVGAPQWMGNGAPICRATGFQTNPGPVPAGTGTAIVAWTDYRNDPANGDIFAARVDKAETAPPFVLKWGRPGSGYQGKGEFQFPYSVAADKFGNVFVGDEGTGLIQKFTAYGGLERSWGGSGSGPGQFLNLRDLAIDAAGNVYAADGNRDVIQKFSSDGQLLMTFGQPGSGPGDFSYPGAIAVDQDGTIYVGEESNYRIQKFTSTGSFLAQIGTGGQVVSLAVGTDHVVYAAIIRPSPGRSEIMKFDPNGNLLGSWGAHGSGQGEFTYPDGIAMDEDGNVVVTDRDNARVQKFTPTGQFLAAWGTYGSADGEFNAPIAVAVDPQGNVYVSDLYTCRIQKFGPGGPNGPGGLKPVVFVNGYCGQSGGWNQLAPYLNAHGFETRTFDFDSSNDRPTALAVQLANHLDSWYPNQNVNVVAHSMGGLVTRQYIRQRKDQSRIEQLVTLDTPHHGVDLMLFAFRHKTVARWLRKTPPSWGLQCLLGGNGAGDLLPGSEFLNNLNYGSPNLGDKPMTSSRGAHAAEINYVPNLKIWSFAGTRNFVGPAYTATSTAWASTRKWYTFGFDYLNDGVVGVDAAIMWNDLSRDCSDRSLGLDPWQHFSMPALYFEDRPVTGAQDLFPVLENILRGGTPPSPPPGAPLLAAQQVQAASDTVVTVLHSEDGTLGAGQVVERTFALPSTPLAQVTFAADMALFRLRMPDGTLLTPADTLTTPWLHYVEEPSLGLAAYRIENPTPGAWKAICDASNAALDQDYALGAEAAVTTQVVVAPASNIVYAPGTVRIRASLEDSSVPQLGVTWATTVTRPDNSTFSLDLFDDGAHQDSLVSDGVYGATLNLSGQLGMYQVSAQATRPSDGATFLGTTVVELATFHDLKIEGDLSVYPNSVHAGDSLIVSAMIKNAGSEGVSNLMVEFWDGQNKYDTVTIGSLGVSASQFVAAVWHATLPETHNLRITVDPFAQPDETNVDNNTVSRAVVLGQPIVGVGPSNDSRPAELWLAPPMPNPSTNQTVLRFSLPKDADAVLVVYDLLGRRLKQWHWSKLPAGQHKVTWDGTTDDGRAIAPSVLFYRLDTGDQHLKQKMIHLQ